MPDDKHILNMEPQEFADAMEEYFRIDNTHSWLFRCFGPNPGKECTICGAKGGSVEATKECPSFDVLFGIS